MPGRTRAIILPLWDHTPDDEIAEIMEALTRIGMDDAIVVSGYVLPDETIPLDRGAELAGSSRLDRLRVTSSPIPGRDGWRRTDDGREWYSAAWLGVVS